MKKFIAFLFAFAFIFTLNLSSVGAQTSGCRPGDNYSSTTGEKCSNTTPTDVCGPGDVYNTKTGEKCADTPTIPAYPRCDRLVNTDLRIGSRGAEVLTLQQALKDEGLLSGKVDGVYGPMTDGAKLSYIKICPPKNSGGVVISGVSGPQTLDVNQTGTWKVSAYDKNGGNLSYAVRWGDEPVYTNTNSGISVQSLSQQSATFTHSYAKAGYYNPTFIVTSQNTGGGSAQTSLTVKVGQTSSLLPDLVITDIMPTSVVQNKITNYTATVNNSGSRKATTSFVVNLGGITTTISSLGANQATSVDGSFGLSILGPNQVCAHVDIWNDVVESNESNNDFCKTVNVEYTTPTENAFIQVLTPNGGESYTVGQDRIDIEFASKGINGKSLAAYIVNKSGNKVLITSGVGGSGYIDMDLSSVGSTNTGDHKITICTNEKINGKQICDTSDNYFTLIKGTTSSSIKVLSPNGIETWRIGESKKITWSMQNIPSTAYLHLALTDGPTPINIKSVYPVGSANSFEFVLPDTGCWTDYCYSKLELGSYKIQATVYDKTPCLGLCAYPSDAKILAQDSSDNYFNVTNKATSSSITVTSPNGGEEWMKDTKNTISWKDTAGSLCPATNVNCFWAGSPYDVKLVSASGAITKIASSTYSYSYTFTPSPDIADGSYTIQVCKAGTSICDSSDRSFTIVETPTFACSYAPATDGCTYTPGPNYDSRTGCGMVLSCGSVRGAEAYNFTLLLKKGSSGNEVMELQKFLKDAGYGSVFADGNFGSGTESAVIKFQLAHGLKGDGVVGSGTRALLNK